MRRGLAGGALPPACREPPAPPPPPIAPAAPAPPERVSEQEPNDFQRAQQLPARAVVTGSLQAPRDDDWYRVGPGPGKALALRIELKGVRDASLETYDRDRNLMLRIHAGAGDPGVVPAMACLEDCFIKVSGAGPQEYELSVVGADPRPGEELEPNNRAVDANELQPGAPMRGTYLSADDEDWFRLALQPGSGDLLRVEVTAVEGVRPDLEVRALADATLLATFHGNDGLFVRNLSLRLGEAASDGGVPSADGGESAAGPGYFLVLKGRSRGGAPLSPYTLTAVVEPGAPDLEMEPNDDPEHATPLRETATGFIAPAGDQDWYRVHADVPMVLHAELSGGDRADLELAAYTAAALGSRSGPEKPRLLARVNEGGPREMEVLPAVGIPAGESFVLVQAAARQLEGKWVRDGEDRQTPYRLSVQLSPDDGHTEREPNDDVATSPVLSLPIQLKGWIWPRKDVDVFRFHVGAGHAPLSMILSA